MNTPVFIEFSQGNRSYIVNLDCVTRIVVNKTGNPCSVEIRYADRTYEMFEGSEHEMSGLYKKLSDGIARICMCFNTDIAAGTNLKPKTTLPNLDQCVLITENENSKEVTKLQ